MERSITAGLVSIPVEIYFATKNGASGAFRQIHEPSGKPVKYLKSVPGIGPIDTDDIAKGYEYDKGKFILLEEDELEAVRLESKKTLELTLAAALGLPVGNRRRVEKLGGYSRAKLEPRR